MISEPNVEKHLNTLFSLEEKLTFFEITTLLAFLYFAEQRVDIAVLETGLGGRLDATNIVTPLVSVITSISLEHTDILGGSLQAIAREKGGIIKPGIPVVLGPRADMVPVPKSSPCIQVQGVFSTFEEENNAIAEKTLECLGVDESGIEQGLAAKLSCRLEKISFQGLAIVFDGAHNPDALDRLFQSLTLGAQRRFRVILGISHTKDLPVCLKVVSENAEHIHLVKSTNERCASPADLQKILLDQGAEKKSISLHASIQEGMEKAIQEASLSNETIVVCGSFYIMDEARQALGKATSFF
jgi:dihydrofolate synthase/folylpolyglutamate synthase